jgi:hypothetical protein
MSCTNAITPSRARRTLRRAITAGAVAVGMGLVTVGTAVGVHAHVGSSEASVAAGGSEVQLLSVLKPDGSSASLAAQEAAAAAAAQQKAAQAAAAQAAAAKAAAQQAAAQKAAAQAAAQQAAAQSAARKATAPSSGSGIVWSTRIVNSGGQAAIDQCLGGLTRMSYTVQGKPYLTIHLGCGGKPVLSLRIGDHIAIDGTQYVVTDARDAAKGVPVSVFYGMHGTAIVQTCFPTGDQVRAVAVTPVG